MTDFAGFLSLDPRVIARQVDARTRTGRAVDGSLHGSQALRGAALAARIEQAERAQRMRHNKAKRRIDPAKQAARHKRRVVKAARKANRR